MFHAACTLCFEAYGTFSFIHQPRSDTQSPGEREKKKTSIRETDFASLVAPYESSFRGGWSTMHRLTSWLLRVAFMLAHVSSTSVNKYSRNSQRIVWTKYRLIAEMPLVMLITKVMLLLYINSVNYDAENVGNTMLCQWGEWGNSSWWRSVFCS